MFREHHFRIGPRGEPLHRIENAFLSAGTLFFTVLTLLILFLGVFVFRAT